MASGRRLAAAIAGASVLALVVVAACGLDVDGTPIPPEVDARPEAAVFAPYDTFVPDSPPPEDVADAGRPLPCLSDRGPAMVEIPDAGFCIDGTEVTRGEFALFARELADGGVGLPDASFRFDDAGPLCTAIDLGSYEDAGSGTAFPVTQVTWCEAQAFCRWAGKRLCHGEVDAGEWTRACSGPDGLPYPYGDASDANRCVIQPSIATERIPTRDGGCAGGYEGLYEMLGNAAEWTDVCEAGMCMTRGGGFQSVTPSCRHKNEIAPTTTSGNVGFRCCRDVR